MLGPVGNSVLRGCSKDFVSSQSNPEIGKGSVPHRDKSLKANKSIRVLGAGVGALVGAGVVVGLRVRGSTRPQPSVLALAVAIEVSIYITSVAIPGSKYCPVITKM